MNESGLKAANIAYSEGDLDLCMKITNQILTDDSGNVEALMLQVKVFYKVQKFGDALNAVNRILEKEKCNKIASNYKEMIVNIMSFWNKDRYNP